ncbi:MAG: hypothetical protein HGA37_15460 [Lentimicrobium sp.]|nr:hypothetical protein [Lentimicrobium sp.]
MTQKTNIEKFYRIAILATAFFVFWIYLGSIINFHQHHIFGRSLMPQGILSKREETVQASFDLPVYLVLFTASCENTEQLLPESTWMVIESVSGVVNSLAPKSGIPLFHGLRAPPVA